ncbi:MAG: hypothetical protein CSA23_05050 [Deltaproteobacteria bacterium]|nr:MAG: hypothetical protein CSA23_05050 [Deltaproteobacteria bacterium]
MIDAFISNGTPGAGAAALDVAVKLGLDYTGWIAAGQTADERFSLEIVTDVQAGSPIERAVEAADGCLFFVFGGRTCLRCETVKRIAGRHGRPSMILDLEQDSGFSASRKIAAWIVSHHVQKPYVDGDDDPDRSASVFRAVCDILEVTFFLFSIGNGLGASLPSGGDEAYLTRSATVPTTLPNAIDHLEAELSLKDRTTIANMEADALVSLHFSLGGYINRHFDLFTTNTDLLRECRKWSGQPHLLPGDAAAVIIRALWERLRQSCRIRIIK